MPTEIINTYDQLRAAGGGIAIYYRGQDRGRGGSPAKWSVLRVDKRGKEVPTDLKAHWFDGGKKTFIVGMPVRIEKPKQLQAAIAWVNEIYGDVGPWVRNRMGDYVHALINQQFPLRKS